jgi:hypothetical protein
MSKRGRPCDSARLLAAAARDPAQCTLTFQSQLRVSAPVRATCERVAQATAPSPEQTSRPTITEADKVDLTKDEVIVIQSDDDVDTEVVLEVDKIASQTALQARSQAPVTDATSKEPVVPILNTINTSTAHVKRRRGTYSKSHISQVQGIFAEVGTFKGTVRLLCATRGYEHIDRKVVKRLVSATVHQKRGRKINYAFDEEVRHQLIIVIFESNTVDSIDKAHRVVSIAYSRDLIVRAAKYVAALPHWKSNADVQKLTFSVGWVSDWLNRVNLGRRRITTSTKDIDIALVRAVMAEIQQVCLDISAFCFL